MQGSSAVVLAQVPEEQGPGLMLGFVDACLAFLVAVCVWEAGWSCSFVDDELVISQVFPERSLQ